MPGASSLRRDVNTGVMAQAVAQNATEIGRGVVNSELTATHLWRLAPVQLQSDPRSTEMPVLAPVQSQLQRPSQNRRINRSAPHVKQHQVHFLDVCADIGWDRNDVIGVRAPQSILTA